jgi:tetratricopeptide (TPR) repeat protein
LRRAEEIARRVGARDIRAQAMQDLAINLTQSGRPREALEMLEEAFRLAKEVGERLNLQRMYNNYASTLLSFGDLSRAREIAAEGMELGRRIGGIGWLAWMVGTAGEISLALGDLDDAERLTQEALDLAIAAHDEPLIALRYPIQAQVFLLRGRIDEAEAELARAHELLLEEEEPQGEIPRSWTEAMLAAARGREQDALEHLRHGTELAARFSVDFTPQLGLDLVRTLVSRGEREEAIAARAVLERGGSPVTAACAEVADGLLEPDKAGALGPLRAAVDHFAALGTKVDLARALLDLGRAERRAGRDPRPSFERALELLVACDARYFVPEAEAELASLG